MTTRKQSAGAANRPRPAPPKPVVASGFDGRKLRVPEPPPAVFAAALRIATGRARKGDAEVVTRELPGHELVLTARALVLRWLWCKEGSRPY